MKRFSKKAWRIAGICVVCAALVIGAVAYFAVFLPQQRERDERAQMVQQYRDAKMEQYRRENESFADYEVEVAFLGDSLTDGYDLAKYYPQVCNGQSWHRRRYDLYAGGASAGICLRSQASGGGHAHWRE